MNIKNIVFTSLITTYLLLFLSTCCPTDCVSDADFLIEFYDAQTGEEIRINPSCEQDNPNRKADIQIVNQPQGTYSNYYCGHFILMTYEYKSSDLCNDPNLTFHILYEEQIVETVTVTYQNSTECGCLPVCMVKETVTVAEGSEVEDEFKINIRI